MNSWLVVFEFGSFLVCVRVCECFGQFWSFRVWLPKYRV